MKVKQITKRGEQRWLVDGKINGKRQRMFFDTNPQAQAWLKAEQKDVNSQAWWLDLSHGERIDMMNAFERSRSEGFSLMDVFHLSAAFNSSPVLPPCFRRSVV